MKKPTKSAFGWTVNGHWTNGDQDAYYDAMKAWENQPKGIGGRPASKPIHESWSEISKLFDSSSFYRSRRAFCRWAGINYSTFSAMQRRPLGDDVESWVLEWNWIGDGEGLEGSWNTNQDRVKKEVQNG